MASPFISIFILSAGIVPIPTLAAPPTLYDENAVKLSILAHHPFPDKIGDPFGVPTPQSNFTEDWMSYYYKSFWFPTTQIDGYLQVAGATSFLETLNRYRDLVIERSREPSPFALEMEGTIVDNNATADITIYRLAQDLLEAKYVLRVVPFEDDVYYDEPPSNGITNHRFLVRAPPEENEITVNEDTISFQFQFPISEQWNVERFGITAYIQVVAGTPQGLKNKEVLQAATYFFSQEEKTVQRSKGVLLEIFTATWCAACVFGDLAVDELAVEFGIRSSTYKEPRWRYLEIPSISTIIISTVSSMVLALLVLYPIRKQHSYRIKISSTTLSDDQQ